MPLRNASASASPLLGRLSVFLRLDHDFTRRGVGPVSALVRSMSFRKFASNQGVPMLELKRIHRRKRESVEPAEWTDELVAEALDRPGGWVLEQAGEQAELFYGLYDVATVSKD